jgi:hypothetical protein
MTMSTPHTVCVNYHGLPAYLKQEAIRRARAGLGLGLSDLMLGRAEFRLSPRHPETDKRSIVEILRTTIA